MKFFKKSLYILTISAFMSTVLFSASAENGRKIFVNKKIGNCIACHDVSGEKLKQPGVLGPKLANLVHWPDEQLYAKLFDPTTTSPLSAMPPFGANAILNESQLQDLVAYLKTIK